MEGVWAVVFRLPAEQKKAGFRQNRVFLRIDSEREWVSNRSLKKGAAAERGGGRKDLKI
jgi:hypothetical protein